MDRWMGRVALVTGASAGIGRVLSVKLAQAGMKVIGCGRNTTHLEEVASSLQGSKGSFEGVHCDLRKEESILQMFETIKKKHGRLDVCINNAGLSHKAPLLTGETDSWRDILEVNVLALCICTREAVKLMDQAAVDDGHVFHISSMSGHRLVSGSSPMYAASKFAVRCLTEALRQELRQKDSNIRITEISPGLVKTTFAHRSMNSVELAEKFYEDRAEECLDAENVADSVIYALSAPPTVQIHDILMRATKQKA